MGTARVISTAPSSGFSIEDGKILSSVTIHE